MPFDPSPALAPALAIDTGAAALGASPDTLLAAVLLALLPALALLAWYSPGLRRALEIDE